LVVKVRLAGLKIARSRGKYYVYVRATGEALLKGFEGSKDDLRKRLAMPDLIGAYNVRRRRDPKTYPEKTLGWLVAWFTDPKQCPEFGALAEVTQGQYKEGLQYLEPEYDCPLAAITQADLYEVRDKCVSDKWPTFADKMMTALSSMFTKAVKRGKMPSNPAIGIDKARKSNPNANREWLPQEWETVIGRAPAKFKTIFMLARYIGYRGQSLARLQWSNYQPDPAYGKCFRATHKKNAEQTWIPAAPELQAYLDQLVRTSTHIATKHSGSPWRDEEQMQKAVSNWLGELEAEGIVGEGLTLHGLRVTFAAALKRRGANTSNVAAALGDRDERMGAHYTRHVENEAKVIQAFGRPKKKK
jgi:integrase